VGHYLHRFYLYTDLLIGPLRAGRTAENFDRGINHGFLLHTLTLLECVSTKLDQILGTQMSICSGRCTPSGINGQGATSSRWEAS
jgi:hypothetical protein